MSQSSMCEVLGPQQRRWMAEHLAASTAPLTLVLSGSVLLGSVGFRDRKGECSEDDWGVSVHCKTSVIPRVCFLTSHL